MEEVEHPEGVSVQEEKAPSTVRQHENQTTFTLLMSLTCFGANSPTVELITMVLSLSAVVVAAVCDCLMSLGQEIRVSPVGEIFLFPGLISLPAEVGHWYPMVTKVRWRYVRLVSSLNGQQVKLALVNLRTDWSVRLVTASHPNIDNTRKCLN